MLSVIKPPQVLYIDEKKLKRNNWILQKVYKFQENNRLGVGQSVPLLRS